MENTPQKLQSTPDLEGLVVPNPSTAPNLLLDARDPDFNTTPFPIAIKARPATLSKAQTGDGDARAFPWPRRDEANPQSWCSRGSQGIGDRNAAPEPGRRLLSCSRGEPAVLLPSAASSPPPAPKPKLAFRAEVLTPPSRAALPHVTGSPVVTRPRPPLPAGGCCRWLKYGGSCQGRARSWREARAPQQLFLQGKPTQPPPRRCHCHRPGRPASACGAPT